MAIYETATKLANEIKSSKEYTQFKKYMQEVKKGPCLMAEKPKGRFLTKEGSSPEWYMPKGGFWSG